MAALDHDYIQQAFNTATAGAAGTLVVLIGFLAAVWGRDVRAAQATLAALPLVAFSLGPYAFVTVAQAFAGQREKVSLKWLLNYRQSLAAYLLMILGPWFWGVIKWYYSMREILVLST